MPKSKNEKTSTIRTSPINFIREIKELMATIERLTNNILENEYPKITFQFPPELTKAKTLTLYKWMMVYDAYLFYIKLHDNQAESAIQREAIVETAEERKRKTTEKKYLF